MEYTYRLMATRSAPIWDGSSKTLLQLGYSDAGLDDCYQLCGSYGPEKCASILCTFTLAHGDALFTTSQLRSLPILILLYPFCRHVPRSCKRPAPGNRPEQVYEHDGHDRSRALAGDDGGLLREQLRVR